MNTLHTNLAGARNFDPQATANRTFEVFYKRDFRPGNRLHWRVAFHGNGNWCVGDGQQHAFQTESEAFAAGERWVETGLDRVAGVAS